jgi:hypothetical protein
MWKTLHDKHPRCSSTQSCTSVSSIRSTSTNPTTNRKEDEMTENQTNQNDKQHLARAVECLAKSKEYYYKAADEILAAKAADPALSNRKVGKALGRGYGPAWVAKLLAQQAYYAWLHNPARKTEGVQIALPPATARRRLE